MSSVLTASVITGEFVLTQLLLSGGHVVSYNQASGCVAYHVYITYISTYVKSSPFNLLLAIRSPSHYTEGVSPW